MYPRRRYEQVAAREGKVEASPRRPLECGWGPGGGGRECARSVDRRFLLLRALEDPMRVIAREVTFERVACGVTGRIIVGARVWYVRVLGAASRCGAAPRWAEAMRGWARARHE